MKVSAKNVALSTLEVAKESNIKQATEGLFAWLKAKNAMKLLPLILLEIDRAAEAGGLVVATVVSARELSTDQKLQVIQRIKKVSGADNVNLENKIDPKVIGGVRISFGDRVIDMTVKFKLVQLTAELSNS